MNDDSRLFSFVFGVIVAVLFMLASPMQCADKEAKQDAVDHGAAVWETDQKTGKTTFKWKDEIKQ
jgi:hypothetical protein